MNTDAEGSLDGAEAAQSDLADESYEEYPRRSVTTDAVYVVTQVDFVPTRTVNVGSLFDDSDEALETSWKRARAVSSSISTKPVATGNFKELEDMARALTRAER
jgi:hypothetical protein